MDGGEVDVPLLVSELRVLQYTNYLQNYCTRRQKSVVLFLFTYPYSMVHAIYPRSPHLNFQALANLIWLSAGGLFFLSFYTFKPTILIEPVFKSAEFGSFGWNRGDAINRLCEKICKLVLDLWNKIQLHFPFWIKFPSPFNPRKKLRLLSECHLTNSCRRSRSFYTVCFKLSM
jgi:hypothetical protein